MALERIVEAKRREVASGPSCSPGDSRGPAASGKRSLAAALSGPRTGFILECKKASPSKGVIRADYDPVSIALEYEPFASAVSVLTDGRFFGGSFEDLRRVREAVSVPVMCKDVIVDPSQIDHAAAAGADAVLLMLSVLDGEAFDRCRRRADELGLETLVEIRDERELEIAVGAGARLIGINNRSLESLRVDLSTTARLAPLVPGDRIVVAESGVTGPVDARSLAGFADALLVGGSLMERPDLSRAVRELVFGRVKICGLTRPLDAAGAWEAGAVFGGLIFAPESPRAVTIRAAGEIVRAAPLSYVGVFANEAPAEVARAANALGLFAVQLHGEEDPSYLEALREELEGRCEIWKAVRVGPGGPGVFLGADRVLLDSYLEGARGGTGRSFDWSPLEGGDNSDTVIAGGIRHGNILAARSLDPYAVDVCSGVEDRPGVKDARALRRLFEGARTRSGVRR